jgi:hypothetical protein
MHDFLMRFNSAQKAQQALEELSKNEPWDKRLEDAWIHLTMAGRRDYAEDSQEIVDAFESGEIAAKNGDHESLAIAIQAMIQHIFMEEGANGVREKFR